MPHEIQLSLLDKMQNTKKLSPRELKERKLNKKKKRSKKKVREIQSGEFFFICMVVFAFLSTTVEVGRW